MTAVMAGLTGFPALRRVYPLISFVRQNLVIQFPQYDEGIGIMARSDMSDLEWEFIEAVLPDKVRGKKRVDDRRVIDGIFCALRTGVPWADLPGEYGPPTTVYNRFDRWSHAGHRDRIMEAVADDVDTGLVDSTVIRARHSATTLERRPAPLFRVLADQVGSYPAWRR